eukprot:GHRR01028058.1.p1 GENE.GHRR01028058.1~~GHRR01028058.1.p1  ORF type:complete len:165 (+),score=13.51 GHRR01028058.1:749-1243(+)
MADVLDEGSQLVLMAVQRLLSDARFQDVVFVCSDGKTVSSNRAFLGARCDYFDKLLYGGGFKEGQSQEIRLQAPSSAVRHILVHLHTGNYSTITADSCWITLMETCALAQMLMLPTVVQYIADRVLADLQPKDVGSTLSYALKVITESHCRVIACLPASYSGYL